MTTYLVPETGVNDFDTKQHVAGLLADAMAQVHSPVQRPVDAKHAEWFLTGIMAATMDVWRFRTLDNYRLAVDAVFASVTAEIPTPKYSPGRFNPFKKRDKKYRDEFTVLFFTYWNNLVDHDKERIAYEDKIIEDAIANAPDYSSTTRPVQDADRTPAGQFEAVTTTYNVPSVDRTATVEDMQQWARDVKTNMEAVAPVISMISSFDPDKD